MNISTNDKSFFQKRSFILGALLLLILMMSLMVLALSPPKHKRTTDPELSALEPFLREWAKEEIMAELTNREVLKFKTIDGIVTELPEEVHFICGTVVLKSDDGEDEKLLWVFRFSKSKDGTWIRRRAIRMSPRY